MSLSSTSLFKKRFSLRKGNKLRVNLGSMCLINFKNLGGGSGVPAVECEIYIQSNLFFLSNPKTGPPGVPLKLLIGLSGFEVEAEEHRWVPFFVFAEVGNFNRQITSYKASRLQDLSFPVECWNFNLRLPVERSIISWVLVFLSLARARS